MVFYALTASKTGANRTQVGRLARRDRLRALGLWRSLKAPSSLMCGSRLLCRARVKVESSEDRGSKALAEIGVGIVAEQKQ